MTRKLMSKLIQTILLAALAVAAPGCWGPDPPDPGLDPSSNRDFTAPSVQTDSTTSLQPDTDLITQRPFVRWAWPEGPDGNPILLRGDEFRVGGEHFVRDLSRIRINLYRKCVEGSVLPCLEDGFEPIPLISVLPTNILRASYQPVSATTLELVAVVPPDVNDRGEYVLSDGDYMLDVEHYDGAAGGNSNRITVRVERASVARPKVLNISPPKVYPGTRDVEVYGINFDYNPNFPDHITIFLENVHSIYLDRTMITYQYSAPYRALSDADSRQNESDAGRPTHVATLTIPQTMLPGPYRVWAGFDDAYAAVEKYDGLDVVAPQYKVEITRLRCDQTHGFYGDHFSVRVASASDGYAWLYRTESWPVQRNMDVSPDPPLRVFPKRAEDADDTEQFHPIYRYLQLEVTGIAGSHNSDPMDDVGSLDDIALGIISATGPAGVAIATFAPLIAGALFDAFGPAPDYPMERIGGTDAWNAIELQTRTDNDAWSFSRTLWLQGDDPDEGQYMVVVRTTRNQAAELLEE